MEDLLGAYSTCAAWLGNLAVDARFELARFRAEPEKFKDLSAVERFLKSTASARIKYPVRMKNLESWYRQKPMPDLMQLEENLFELLTRSSATEPSEIFNTEGVADLGRCLCVLAERLFEIDRQHSERLHKYLDEHGV